ANTTSAANFYAGGGGQEFSNMNLKFSSDQMITFFFAKLKEEILKIKETNEKNFAMAVALKNEGVFNAYRKEIRGIEVSGTDQNYQDAISYYRQVSKEYLNQTISVVGVSGSDLLSVPRRFLFLYPDYRVPFHPAEPRTIIQFFNSSSFIDYVISNNLFDGLYENAADFNFFALWFLDYQVVMSSLDWFFHDPIPLEKLDRLATKLEERKANQTSDLNILYLHLSEQAFNQNKVDQGITYLKKIQPDKLLNAFQYKNFTFVNDYSFKMLGKAIANSSSNNQFDVAYKLLDVFKKEVNRSSLYGYASQIIILRKQKPEVAQRLLDSAQIEMKRLDNPAVFQPNRHQVAIALMYQDPEKNSKEGYQTIKNSFNKFAAITEFSRAHAMNEDLYKAKQQAPGLISSADKGFFFVSIAQGYAATKSPIKEWKKFQNNGFFFNQNYPIYVNENQ
ncbi:MAG: hypothetical protein H0U44_01530, partial [Flavisolibacter sp.]|nr:hypothetical protein [Flavisolibacter sp.]